MVDAYEYCRPETLEKICRPGKMHLECGAPEKSPKYECQKVAPLLPMTRKVKRYLLDLHNGWRDKVAGGEETGGKQDILSVFQIMDEVLQPIYDGKSAIADVTNMTHCSIDNYRCKGAKYLSLIQERMSRMGCAYAFGYNCSHSPGNNYRFCNYFACNYDFENKPYEIVYQTGNQPASDCGHWGAEPSKKWPNLCTNTGERFKYVSISPDHPFGLG
uniref:SCP domain-containing protein n=1 Tax=Glossina morsitans morsitans TaxID=37546 RepID=A0A1B0G2L8_GLOMM